MTAEQTLSADAQKPHDFQAAADPGSKASTSPVALVLILGTGPCARSVREAGAFPVELRDEDPHAAVSVAGFAELAGLVDVVLATRDWNASAPGRAAVLAAGKEGVPVFFELADFRAWLGRWRSSMSRAGRIFSVFVDLGAEGEGAAR